MVAGILISTLLFVRGRILEVGFIPVMPVTIVKLWPISTTRVTISLTIPVVQVEVEVEVEVVEAPLTQPHQPWWGVNVDWTIQVVESTKPRSSMLIPKLTPLVTTPDTCRSKAPMAVVMESVAKTGPTQSFWIST